MKDDGKKYICVSVSDKKAATYKSYRLNLDLIPSVCNKS